MSDEKYKKDKPFPLFNRLSDWVLCGISVACVAAFLVNTGRTGEQLESQLRINVDQNVTNKSLQMSIDGVKDGMSKMAIAQGITNTKLESIDKNLGNIRDLKEYNQGMKEYNLKLERILNRMNRQSVYQKSKAHKIALR